MNNIQPILDELASFDLSKYPEDEVRNCLMEFGKVLAIKQTLHPGTIIMRGRPNGHGEHYSKLSEVSYKPQQFNTTYQRASTPNHTMFYGATVPQGVKNSGPEITRVIPLFEALPLMRDLDSSGEQLITFSKWKVTKDIPLISVIHYEKFKGENAYAAQQRQDFEITLKKLSADVAQNTRLATSFMANEFAKEITPKDYHYIISAMYTELIALNQHAAGVYYPSVRTGGQGFNVAIHPDIVHNNMELEVVGECTIYKKKKKTIVDNETIAMVLKNQTEFELKPVLPQYHIGRDKALKMLDEP